MAEAGKRARRRPPTRKKVVTNGAVRTTMWLDETLIARLDDLASSQEVTRSSLMRVALWNYVNGKGEANGTAATIFE